ncbi:hypothetical protein RKD46_002609 [Streptomyces pseudovenezuelae]
MNRKTISAAAATAGARAGRVTVRQALSRDAPSMRAASSWRGSSWAHSPPTVRTTTA